MERRWYHEVSAAWLEARRSVISATEVVALLPAYKRWKKLGDANAISPEFSALWAKKLATAEPDCSSKGAAARGHIMEPWAVRSWNAQSEQEYFHWDDCVIANGILGFSPDAMTVRQEDDRPARPYWEPEIADVESVMEVKCYEVSNHMKAICKDRMEHEEIMQIAMAFAVLPGLTHARILWFCPDAPISMHSEEYERDELAEQIQLVNSVASVFRMHCDHWHGEISKGTYPMKAQCTEEEVWNDYLLSQKDCGFLLK